MDAVFLDFETVSNGDVDTARLDAVLPGVEYFPATGADDVVGRVHEARVVLMNKAVLDRETIGAARGLRLVCLAATGVDNVDLEAAAERGVAVCNIRDYCTASVVQHVFALVLCLTQRIVDYAGAVSDGAWSVSRQFCLLGFPIRELEGKALGIVGYGTLGRGVARLGAALGMRVLIAERHGAAPRKGRTLLDEVLAEADVLSLHCPLTPETRGLIGAPELARMKPDAVLVNTARGALVDGRALADALREGRLGGAGIDVLPVEPPAADDPLLAKDIPNLVVTPHIAWAAREARQRAVDEMAANVEAFLRGERRNRVL